MNSRFLLPFLVAAALSSCSTAYKSGQTPDDVYYSPAKDTEEYLEVRQSNSNRARSYEYDNFDDRWLRMRVRNPYRWNAFDDYDWNTYGGWSNNWYSPFANNWNSYWNGYYTWNSWYNPYCRNVIILNPKTNPTAFNKVRNFSLNSYTNTNYNTNNALVRSPKNAPMRLSSNSGSYNNSNSNTLGSSLRKVFSGSNNSNYNNNSGSYSPASDRSSRSYTPSNSSSSSGSSSSGSSSGGSSSGGSSSGRRGG